MKIKVQPQITLRSHISRLALITLLVAGISAVAVTVGYSHIKSVMRRDAAATSLTRFSALQVEALTPSLILPEQRAGAELLLQKFMNEEGLSQAKLLGPNEAAPEGFSDCKPTPGRIVFCVSDHGSESAVIIPVTESRQMYGYLFKSKPNADPFGGSALVGALEAMAVALVFALLAIFALVARVTTRDIPASLHELVEWIEAVMQERTSAQAPNLRFEELNSLARKIAEVIERNERDRDQAVIGQLSSGIMHDIKTPLHSIVTALHLLQELPEGSPRRASRLENLAKVCAARIPLIGEIIETTLDGSRQIHLEPVEADLVETVRGAVALTGEFATAMRTEIRFSAPTTPLPFRHDPTQLSRVCVNLVRNAVEAAAQSAEARVARVHVSIEPPRQGDSIPRIVVEDTGPGVPQDPERIFRAFRSKKARGSGLGLLISRKIVEAHQGRLVASGSEELQGARFEVRLGQNESNAEVTA